MTTLPIPRSHSRLRRRSLILAAAGLAVVLLVSAVSGFSRSAREEALASTLAEARAIVAESFATLAFFEKLGAPHGALRREEMAVRLERELASATDADDRAARLHRSGFFQTVPVVAAWNVARRHAAELGHQFRTPRHGARNPANEPDVIEARLLSELATGRSEAWIVDEEHEMLRFAAPVRLTVSCLPCHGRLEDDPDGDGRDPLGAAMENGRLGELYGAFEVIGDLDPALARARVLSTQSAGIGLIASLLALGIVLYLRGKRSSGAGGVPVRTSGPRAPRGQALGRASPAPRGPLPDPVREPAPTGVSEDSGDSGGAIEGQPTRNPGGTFVT